MNIGLYFGSFNPVHTGHLIIASHVVNYTDVQQVWLVVSPQNPFKQSASLLNEYDRLHLVNLAIDDETRIKASDVEFKLPRISLTEETICMFFSYIAFALSAISFMYLYPTNATAISITNASAISVKIL